MKKDHKVYYHRSRTSGKYYVGVAKNIDKRWGTNGSHYKSSRHFWRAIKKYGWDDFEHVVLIDNLTKDEAYQCEKYLIDKYDLTHQGYNMARGGIGGATVWGKNHHHSRKVYQYDAYTGEYIGEYENVKAASNNTGVSYSDISHCAIYREKGIPEGKCNIGQAGGYIWTYEYIKNVKPNILRKHNILNRQKIKVLGFNRNLEQVIEYDDIIDIPYSRSNRLREKIKKVLDGKSIWYKDHTYCYEGEFDKLLKRIEEYNNRPPIEQVGRILYQCDNDLNIIETYISANQASKVTGFKMPTIGAACRGYMKNHYTQGYYWIYADEYDAIKEAV